MNPGPDVEVRALTPADREALSTFSCRDFRQPWSDLVQEMVREHLVDALEHGGISALGLWVGAQLVGVAAWRIDVTGSLEAPLCRSIVVAVRNGHVRRGYGRRLKRELVQRAREAGAVAVVSIVHWDNDAMIQLNIELGASINRIEGDPDHCYCVIPL